MTWVVFVLFFNADYEPRITAIGPEHDTREECMERVRRYRDPSYDNIVSAWCELESRRASVGGDTTPVALKPE